jgi:hypothetical protein
MTDQGNLPQRDSANPAFGVGTCSTETGRPFAAVFLNDHVIPLTAFGEHMALRKCPVSPQSSTRDLLEDWAEYFPALNSAVSTVMTARPDALKSA